MNRVERRYRRLVRLLPAEERATRGEELLGLLLDLEGERERPSSRETAGLLALAVRLHARRLGVGRVGLGLFTAYLLVIGTILPAQMLGIAVSPGPGSPFDGFTSTVFAFVVMRLAGAVAWLLGAHRIALIAFGLSLVYDIRGIGDMYVPGSGFGFLLFVLGGVPGLIWIAVTYIGVPVVLGLAIRRPPRRLPPRIGLAGLAIAFAVQAVMFVGSGPDPDSALSDVSRRYAAWLLIAACTAVAVLHARRRGRRVLIAAIATAWAGAWLVSLTMPRTDAAAVAATVLACETARSIAARRAAPRRPAALRV